MFLTIVAILFTNLLHFVNAFTTYWLSLYVCVQTSVRYTYFQNHMDNFCRQRVIFSHLIVSLIFTWVMIGLFVIKLNLRTNVHNAFSTVDCLSNLLERLKLWKSNWWFLNACIQRVSFNPFGSSFVDGIDASTVRLLFFFSSILRIPPFWKCSILPRRTVRRTTLADRFRLTLPPYDNKAYTQTYDACNKKAQKTTESEYTSTMNKNHTKPHISCPDANIVNERMLT